MVDTNSDPRPIDYVIPANDDASKSIEKVLGYIIDAVANGLAERKAGKEKAAAPKAEAPKKEEAKVEAPKAETTEAKTEEAK